MNLKKTLMSKLHHISRIKCWHVMKYGISHFRYKCQIWNNGFDLLWRDRHKIDMSLIFLIPNLGYLRSCRACFDIVDFWGYTPNVTTICQFLSIWWLKILLSLFPSQNGSDILLDRLDVDNRKRIHNISDLTVSQNHLRYHR